MTPPLIIANWKMNLDLEGVRRWCAFFEDGWGVSPEGVDVVVCPSFVHLLFASGRLLERGFLLGAQDCSAQENGPSTGDVSAAMLKDAGCTYVLVGHSERRAFHGEKDTLLLTKIERVSAQNMIPVLCVGETLEDRCAGLTQVVLTNQLQEGLPPRSSQECVIAYEPVWAIGTGKVPQPVEIERAHALLREQLVIRGYPDTTKIVYGGSVSPANAQVLLDISGVDGLLVGGASLDPSAFQEILSSASKKDSIQEVNKASR